MSQVDTSAADDRQRVLARRLAAEGSAAEARIPRRDDRTDVPVSAAQQRIWFLEQLQPGTPFYTIAAAFRLVGPLDEPALASALTAVTARHEVLRGRFEMIAGTLRQQIAPVDRLPLAIVDLQAHPADDRAAEAQRRAQGSIRQPFDLVRGPLLRAGLYRLGVADHVFVVAVHHIAFDAGSVGVLVHELGELYDAARANRRSRLPELPIQYADYAAWQVSPAQCARWDGDLAYWRAQLAGAPAALGLPADHARPEVQRFRGARVSRAIEAALAARVAEFSRRHAVSPFVTLLSAFAVLLSRYTGETDILVGCPVASRSTHETERLIGLFVNLLVVRADLSGDPTFATVVARLRRTIAAAHAHDAVPFDALVGQLRPERRLSHTPIVQVMFTLQSIATRLQLADLEVSPIAVETGTAKFDLTLNIVDRGDEVAAHLEYDADLFAPDRITRMLGHYRSLLEAALDDADRRIGWLPMLSAGEARAHLDEWNTRAATTAVRTPVHRLVAERAAATPAALAVADGRTRVSYGELDWRARSLAARLRQQGAGPEQVVAIWCRRSTDLVIAALGTLYSGAAYLPIDPRAPDDRVAFMLDALRVRVVVTETAEARCLADRVVLRPPLALTAPDEGRECAIAAENLAYAIFTSGSTGAPKAVAVPHAALANLVSWHRRAYRIGPTDRATLVASPAFDAEVWELWPYLAAGASVHVAPEAALDDPAALCRWLDAERISCTFLPTPLAEAVLQESASRSLPLRLLLTGGDRLRDVPAHSFPFTIVNHYGPTENGVVSTAAEVAPGATAVPPIGCPIDGTEAYVLDGHGELVPVGIVGELFVAGDSLARGYCGSPELTAERFVPHPFARRPGARLYATGDLVRRRADGVLDFIGRRDGQVKLRGFRIELGEIESALMQHPTIRACAAMAWQGAASDPRLIAYVVVHDGATATVDEWRAHLAARLPEYMLPAAFVRVAALPLTANGKIDRARLPAPPLETEGRRGQRPPASAIERTVARVWSQILGVPAPDLDDDFFAAGGHSVMAMRLLSRLRAEIGVDLPVRELFRRPTLGGLAAAVDAALESSRGAVRSHAGLAPPPSRVAEAASPCPLSFAQERLWLLDRLAPGSSAYNVAAAVRLLGDLDVNRLLAALQQVIARHDVLRTRFVDVAGTPAQVVDPSGELSAERREVTRLPASAREAEARRIARDEALRPFDLRIGPLLRLCLVRLDVNDHVLVVATHHIVCDAASIEVLVRELSAVYGGQAGVATLPPLALQYREYAAWQRADRADAQVARDVDYWRERLRDVPPYLHFPGGRAAEVAVASSGDRVRIDLPPPVAAAVVAFAVREGVTPFMVVTAALAAVIGAWTGASSLVIVTSVDTRDRPEFEPLIGPFLNLVPIRVDVNAGESGRDLVARVRESVLSAFAHRQLPFEMLIQRLGVGRQGSRPPFSQIGLVLTTPASVAALQIPGVSVQTFSFDVPTSAKADLMWCLSQAAEGMGGVIEFDPNVLDVAAVTGLAAAFVAALDALSIRPESSVTSTSAPGGAALSTAQLRYWAGQQMVPGVPLYNMAGVFAIEGPVDPRRFERAYDVLVASSDVMTTAFDTAGGMPRQVPVAARPAFHRLDLSAAPDPSRALAEWAAVHARRPFDLSAPPMESALVRLSPARFAWYVCVHQLLADALSIMLMFRRIREFYEAGATAAVPLPRFDEYREVERVRRERHPDRHGAWWQQRLADLPPRVALYGQAAVGETLRACRTTVALDAAQAAVLERLATQAGGGGDLGRFGVAAAIVMKYLERASGCQAVTLGMTRHDRTSRRFADTIGMFVDVVPLPLRWSVGTTLAQLSRLIVDRALDTLKHGSPPAARPGGGFACDVVFNYVNATVERFAGHAVTVDWVHCGFQREALVVHLRRIDSHGRMAFELDWNRGLFEARMTEIATDHFASVVQQELAESTPAAVSVDARFDF